MKKAAAFLVRHRTALFVLMTVLALLCAYLMPRATVNTDMTRYLPDDSPMKIGMDLVESELPGVAAQMESLGSSFADGTQLMPADLPRTIATGVAMVFVVLLLMCSSVMEVLLFLVTTGFAVAINMGTNALLPSVSLMTHMLAAVLQMVLSMDYCIILMNSYRQERALGKAPVTAMGDAVSLSASSILSSALTTIVSLLMLVFIKLKIGADLGVVLSKGVVASLVCSFTVLPALIVWFDKAVEATKKKVPKLPYASLASFEEKFKYPLLVLFLGIFVAFTFLKERTELIFSPTWESPATMDAPQDNAFLLIYPTAEEDRVTALLDSLASMEGVKQCLSYPSLVLRPRTAAGMMELFSQFGEAGADSLAMSEDLLELVYYAKLHPVRDERFSFDELMSVVDSLAARGLLPPSALDIKDSFNLSGALALNSGALAPGSSESWIAAPPGKALLTARDASATSIDPSEHPGKSAPSTDSSEPVGTSAIQAAISDSTALTVTKDDEDIKKNEGQDAAALSELPGASAQLEAGADSIMTYEYITTPMSAEEMASAAQYDPASIKMVYRLAGKAKGKMSPVEFFDFVSDKIITNKRYSPFVPKDIKEQLGSARSVVDSILAAGPTVKPEVPDTLRLTEIPTPSDTTLLALAETSAEDTPAATLPMVEEIARIEEPVEAEPTPVEVLAEMALSGHRYSSRRIHSALAAVGIDVSRAQTDLLFLYAGARKNFDPDSKISPGDLLAFVADTLIVNPAIAPLIPDSTAVMVSKAKEALQEGVGILRGANYSAAAVVTGLPEESPEAFSFVEKAQSSSDASFTDSHYWIGSSVMFKELKDGFPSELMLLTILTVLAIFVIVSITLRSLVIPIPLIMTVLSGIFVNVWASGLGGHTMYYLSYLIIQGILMGATIDYTIVFSNHWLKARKTLGIRESLMSAYARSSHSVLTSGLILSIVPFVMSLIMEDKMIASILSSLAIGTAAILILVLLVLPGVLAATDPLTRKRKDD